MSSDTWPQMRDYFEVGCACIHVHKTVAVPGPEVSDYDASMQYLQHCTCSRQLKPEDWK